MRYVSVSPIGGGIFLVLRVSCTVFFVEIIPCSSKEAVLRCTRNYTLYRVIYDGRRNAHSSFPQFCTELAIPNGIQKERLRGMDLQRGYICVNYLRATMERCKT